MISEFLLEQGWVENRGAACTTAAVLAGLAALGAPNLPDLATATRLIAGREYGAPDLLDYISWPGRRAPLDQRVEAMAAGAGLAVRCRSAAVLPGVPLHPRPAAILVAHLAYGQEAAGRYGTWGWHPIRPSTYATGGHSVILAATTDAGWTVLDPNFPTLQRWPRPGLATAVTRLERAG